MEDSGCLPNPPVTLFRQSAIAGVIYRRMLTMPGQRVALLGVMLIRQKSRHVNGVTACFDSWITVAY